MTRKQTKMMLPILEAFANNKPIQVRRKLPRAAWQDASHDAQEFDIQDDWEWRIKPEPREFWLALHPTKKIEYEDPRNFPH